MKNGTNATASGTSKITVTFSDTNRSYTVDNKVTIKLMKRVMMYIFVVGILVVLLSLSAKIPKSAIQKNIKESVTFF